MKTPPYEKQTIGDKSNLFHCELLLRHRELRHHVHYAPGGGDGGDVDVGDVDVGDDIMKPCCSAVREHFLSSEQSVGQFRDCLESDLPNMRWSFGHLETI